MKILPSKVKFSVDDVRHMGEYEIPVKEMLRGSHGLPFLVGE